MGQVGARARFVKIGALPRVSKPEEWVEAGRISVDGRVIRDPEFLLVPDNIFH